MNILVSIGTDGTRDWVRTPDGQEFNLGSVSVLSFVSKLSRSRRVAKAALDEFLKKGEALLSVDDDVMWSLFSTSPRWASEGSFIALDQRPPTSRNPPMSTIQDDLAATERVVGALNRLASGNKRDPRLVQALLQNVRSIQAPSQSKRAYYGPLTAETPSRLAFDAYQANMTVAKDVLDKAKVTVAKIAALVSQGKRFDANRARGDVTQVTSRVAKICESTELTESWVASDLQKLATQMNKIHGLFHSAS